MPVSVLGLGILLQTGCITDTVPPDTYASSSENAVAEAAPDAAASCQSQPPAVGTASADAGAAPTRDQPLGSDPPTPGCDLTGSWLITERLVASGLGVKQASLNWKYYEIAQSGDQLRVEKGLVCGSKIVPVDAVSAAVDYPAAWPKMMEENPHAGRQGSARASANGCTVSFARIATVIGATGSYYVDEGHPMPTIDQQATGSAPGWEDWDDDGHPAVSMHVSGLATGDRYCATRTMSAWNGEIASGSDHFKLSSPWSSQESVYGTTSDILKSTGAPDGDASLHFAEFAKLSPGQVSGDDATICAQIRQLAPTLTTEANK